MATTKKATTVRRASSSSSKKSKKVSWFGRLSSGRYAKPALVALVFMVIGVGGLLWASAATTTESIWSSSTVPSVLTWSDKSNIELGTKFQASVAGYVTGIRFYKGPQNTGTHTGTLWDASGNRLAGVTFTNETKSGWQTAMLSTPVSIAAGATYVVSYHAPNGHYSLGPDYFKSGAHINGHLTALKYAVSNPNGVYAKATTTSGTTPIFPKTNGDGDSYFVDVLFSAKLIDPQPAPAAPTGVTASANSDSTQVALAWQPSVSQNTIAQYVVYRDGNKIGSAGAMTTYTDTSISVGSTYKYQVQAIDSNNVSSVLSAPVSITIATPPGTGGGGGTQTGTSKCPLPAYPTPACTGVPAGTTFSKTINGDYTITTQGTVIDGWHITGDVEVNAANVTIKNSQIDGVIDNETSCGHNCTVHYGPWSITDSTVGPATGCDVNNQPAIGDSDYTALRVYTRGTTDAFHTGGNNISVSDSYSTVCFLPGPGGPNDIEGGSHSDGIQNVCPIDDNGNPTAYCTNITFTHNTVDNLGVPATFATNLGYPPSSPQDGVIDGNVNVSDNLFKWTGAYVMSLIWQRGPNWTVHNNRVVNGIWTYGATDSSGTCSHIDWQGNTLVNIDSNYNITKTVGTLNCAN